MSLVKKRLKKIKEQKLPKLQIFPQNKFFTENPIDIIEELMEKIASLGLPFFKHRKNSEIYWKSYKRLNRRYSKFREDVFPAFKLASEFFNNSNFIFRPEKISVCDFIKFTPEYLRYNVYAKIFSEKFEIDSLFLEFLKGRDHIEQNYLKIKLPKVDEKLLEYLIKIWKRRYNFREEEKIHFIKFLVNAEKFCKLNPRLNIKSLLIILRDHILIQADFQPHFLNSKLFWENVLPKKICQIGIYSDQTKLKKLGENLE